MGLSPERAGDAARDAAAAARAPAPRAEAADAAKSGASAVLREGEAFKSMQEALSRGSRWGERRTLQWVERQKGASKAPLLAVVVSAFSCFDADAAVTVCDESGEMEGTVHRRVLEEHERDVGVGTAMILRGVSVFSPRPGALYLNITPDNIVRVFAPDRRATELELSLPPSASQASFAGSQASSRPSQSPLAFSPPLPPPPPPAAAAPPAETPEQRRARIRSRFTNVAPQQEAGSAGGLLPAPAADPPAPAPVAPGGLLPAPPPQETPEERRARVRSRFTNVGAAAAGAKENVVNAPAATRSAQSFLSRPAAAAAAPSPAPSAPPAAAAAAAAKPVPRDVVDDLFAGLDESAFDDDLLF